jgi:hypothetical protein
MLLVESSCRSGVVRHQENANKKPQTPSGVGMPLGLFLYLNRVHAARGSIPLSSSARGNSVGGFLELLMQAQPQSMVCVLSLSAMFVFAFLTIRCLGAFFQICKAVGREASFGLRTDCQAGFPVVWNDHRPRPLSAGGPRPWPRLAAFPAFFSFHASNHCEQRMTLRHPYYGYVIEGPDLVLPRVCGWLAVVGTLKLSVTSPTSIWPTSCPSGRRQWQQGAISQGDVRRYQRRTEATPELPLPKRGTSPERCSGGSFDDFLCTRPDCRLQSASQSADADCSPLRGDVSCLLVRA